LTLHRYQEQVEEAQCTASTLPRRFKSHAINFTWAPKLKIYISPGFLWSYQRARITSQRGQVPFSCWPNWRDSSLNLTVTNRNLLQIQSHFPCFIGFLVGGLEHFLLFHSVGNFIIPTDVQAIIFKRGRAQPPTSLCGSIPIL
jgi:hypothetical protein